MRLSTEAQPNWPTSLWPASNVIALATGNPGFPRRVTCISAHNVRSDLAWRTPERDVPEHVQFLAEFPSGFVVTITCSSVNAKSSGFAI